MAHSSPGQRRASSAAVSSRAEEGVRDALGRVEGRGERRGDDQGALRGGSWSLPHGVWRGSPAV
jgi:hypothetical protein